VAGQPSNNRLRSHFRQRLVCGLRALMVGLAFDAELQIGILLQQLHEFGRDIFRTGQVEEFTERCTSPVIAFLWESRHTIDSAEDAR
jgi:hypothetical protein